MRKIILVTLCMFLVVEVSYAELGCRMSGGAFSTTSDSNIISLAGQVGASSADQPPKGELVIMNDDFTFQAGTASAPPGTAITEITCFDLGVCDPARPSPANAAMITGIGAFRNIGVRDGLVGSVQAVNATLHSFEVVVNDNGESGTDATAGCPNTDSFGVTIRATSDLGSAVIYEAHDIVITGGNFQIHPPNSGHPYDTSTY